MNAATPPVPERWYLSGRLQAVGISILAVVLAWECYIAVFERENDFVIHHHVGKDFLAGEPYKLFQEVYPLGRTMMNCAFAIEPIELARALTFTVAVASLVGCFFFWRKLAPGVASPNLNRATGLWTAMLFLPYLLRDLDECGLQLLVLLMLSAAAYALYRARPAWSGLLLASAATFKVAPVLFLPFLIWKRQFRAAAWMLAFIAAWALAPALYLGWDGAVEGHTRYLNRAAIILGSRSAYPYQPGIEPPKPQNLSLQAAIARFVETYPPRHRLHLKHPLFFQFGAFDRHTAYLIVRGTMLGLGLVLAWRFRQSWRGDGSKLSEQFPAEWAAVAMLTAILAPICWKQHLVVALPAGFLVIRSLLAQTTLSRWRLAGLGVIAAVIWLGRHGVVGRDMGVVLNSYKIDTFAMLFLLKMVLTMPRPLAPVHAASESGATPPARLAA